MSSTPHRFPRHFLLTALLLHVAAYALPDYWWQGPISSDIHLPPQPGPLRHFYLPQEIHSIFHRGDIDSAGNREAALLDLAARPALIIALLAFALYFFRVYRLAIAAVFLAIVGWVARYWLCCPGGFHLGYFAWLASIIALAIAAHQSRRPLGRFAKWTGRIALAASSLAIATALVLHALRTGPTNLAAYPPRATSPYRLPFAPGMTRFCTQGNNGAFSHFDWQEYAWDFSMPVGSDVIAARSGIVTEVDVSHDGHGFDNNVIVIKHDDRTFASYLHLMKGGSYVKLGQHVTQGQRIAASGDVGYSTSPHLHFDVRYLDPTSYPRLIPITFADVETDSGIPRMMKRYTSGNKSIQ